MAVAAAVSAQLFGFTRPHDQGWTQVWLLLLALALSALIGFEREARHKDAGLRTNTIIGVAAALIMEVSKFGFGDVIGNGVTLDPSRVAAQIVSGIGFIGAGLIFVRRDSVRGLTTAAVVWLTAAVGMACGAGLVVLAVVVTGLYLVVVFVFTSVERLMPRSRNGPARLHVRFSPDETSVSEVLAICERMGFAVARVTTERTTSVIEPVDGGTVERPSAAVDLELRGGRPIVEVASHVADLDGVTQVSTEQSRPPW